MHKAPGARVTPKPGPLDGTRRADNGGYPRLPGAISMGIDVALGLRALCGRASNLKLACTAVGGGKGVAR